MHTYVVSENVLFSTRALLIFADVLIKIVPLFKTIVWELCWRFFSFVFSFFKIKAWCYWKCQFYKLCIQNQASALLQIGHKLEKMTLMSQFTEMKLSSIFWRFFVSLVKFSHWSKFQIEVITGSGIIAIFFIKDWP